MLMGSSAVVLEDAARESQGNAPCMVIMPIGLDSDYKFLIGFIL